MDFNRIPDDETVFRTAAAVTERGIEVIVAADRREALNTVIGLIPTGVEVMNGSSTTLREIGFLDYLKEHGDDYKNMHLPMLTETDQRKQAELRRKSVTAEYFLGSVNAIAETGELFACDATGSRVGAYPFATGRLLLVSGVNKIVPTWQDAMARLREHAYPLEDERARKAYGAPSTIGKVVIIEREVIPGRTTLVLVKEKLGF